MKLRLLRQVVGMAMLTAFILVFIRFDTFGIFAGSLFVPQMALAAIGHFLWAGAVAIVIVLLLTALAGRIYCSTICPLGLIQDVLLCFRRFFGVSRYKTNLAFATPHVIIAGFVAASAVSGFMLPLSLLEPFSMAGRMLAGIVQPLSVGLFKAIGSGEGISWFGQASAKASDGLNSCLVIFSLLIIFFLCIKYGRVYCNSICPVGAVLRLAARRPFLKLAIDPEKCVGCGSCAAECKAGCIDITARKVDNSRCLVCFNCLGTCRFAAISFGADSYPSQKSIDGFSPLRRAIFGGLLSSAAGLLLPKAVLPAQQTPEAILPPGAGDQATFSAKCISCHLCVAACPSAVIRPTSGRSGILSLQQPSLFFEHGMCEQNCNLCSRICPVMAIRPVEAQKKRLMKIGEVVYHQHLCVVETNGTDCGACAEHCPTQAVRMVPYRNGLMIPSTDPSICIGCGSCEHICPVRPQRAIIVKAIDKQTFIELPEPEKLPAKTDGGFPF